MVCYTFDGITYIIYIVCFGLFNQQDAERPNACVLSATTKTLRTIEIALMHIARFNVQNLDYIKHEDCLKKKFFREKHQNDKIQRDNILIK